MRSISALVILSAIPLLLDVGCGSRPAPAFEDAGNPGSDSAVAADAMGDDAGWADASSQDASTSTGPCEDGEERRSEAACGLNGRGAFLERCEAGEWLRTSECDDRDECTDADVEEDPAGDPCGADGRGRLGRLCDRGRWRSTCLGAGECADGDTRSGSTACGLLDRGRIGELCVEGAWMETTECVDPDPDDAELLSEDAELSFTCSGTPLTRDEIVDHFPTGWGIWTPHRDGTGPDLTATRITRYTRECTPLTGCGSWTYVVGERYRDFYLGFYLDGGDLHFWQLSDRRDTLEMALPVSNGRFTATLATTGLSTDPEPVRFLVQVTDRCFAITSLVESQPTPDGTIEIVYGFTRTWTEPPPLRSTPPPAPDLASDECPYEAHPIADIALGWLGAGGSSHLFSGFADLYQTRQCHPETGCTEWRSDSDYASGRVQSLGTTLEIELRGTTYPVAADGTFGSGDLSGHITPTCMRYRRQSTSPGPHVNLLETVEERIVFP